MHICSLVKLQEAHLAHQTHFALEFLYPQCFYGATALVEFHLTPIGINENSSLREREHCSPMRWVGIARHI